MSTIETLRKRYSIAVIAHETAARAHYVAAKEGLRTVGLAKHRESNAWVKVCAAEKAYRAAANTNAVTASP